ncbi:hypothetical protein [Lentzea sp. CC55]|uniref:hypothetical protein n=1 Tax=Lentzea sp. CC55 TaxID=2884909 RepID=UPI001F226676|nr:hypothetical protein [Lentzea sp. CC55]MCG8924850.1 hypothetical protein [Lentzea sp. CC55]
MTEETKKRRGFWRKLWDKMTGRDELPPLPPGPVQFHEVIEHREAEGPLLIPSCAEGFDFSVRYHVVWSLNDGTHDDLLERIEWHEKNLRHDILERIWSAGRDFYPHDPSSAERRMNERLGGGWCYETADRRKVRCEVKVRVNSDARIGEKQQGYYEQLVAMDCDHMLKLRHMANVRCELKGWQQVVEEFGSAIAVVHAARLVDPEVAVVFANLAEERKKSAASLVNVLHTATRDHLQVGLYEFANAYDLAVRSFMQQQGLSTGTLADAFEANAQNSNQD